MTRRFQHFLQCESGMSSVEYGIIGGILALVVLGSTGSLKTNLLALYNKINGNLASAN